MTVTCDESHIYRMDGVVVPGVTQVIDSHFPSRDYDDWYKTRGTAVHHGCHLLNQNKLKWESVDPRIVGRLRAWEKFRKDHPCEVLVSETMYAHPLFRFAGRLDCVFKDDEGLIICDWKSTFENKHKFQVGGYSLLYRINNGNCITKGGLVVELGDNGRPNCHWFKTADLRTYEREFGALLTVFNAARREKISLPGDKSNERHSDDPTTC